MECQYCGREYKIKSYFNRHVISCQMLHTSSKDLRDFEECMADTPNIRNLYEIVLELNTQVKQLQTKIKRLENEKRSSRKKINVLDWLVTQDTPRLTWLDWSTSINCTTVALKNAFKTDIIASISKMIIEKCDKSDKNLPLKAFEQKPNIIYIYKDSEWIELSSTCIEKMIRRIHQEYNKFFVEWQQNAEKEMSADTFMSVFTENIQKINCSTTEKIAKTVSKNMYNHLKINLKSVVQLEFE